MRVKSLVTFRSKSIRFEEAKMEKPVILDPSTVWETSMVTEEQIQSLVDPWPTAAQVACRVEAGGRGGVPDRGHRRDGRLHRAHRARIRRPCGLLQFYRIELVHLAPKSITIITTLIHLCEAFLDSTPHLHLWRHFFELKKTGKGVVVDSVNFMLRRNMKSEYIDLELPDNTTGWKQRWFYLDNPTPALKSRTGRVPVMGPEWTNQLATLDTQELKPLLDDLQQLKAEGLVVWTSLGPLPRWVPGSTTRWAPGTTRLALHGT
jgi:hypothetical protein